MLDHYTLLVSDFKRSLEFYAAALKPLGYTLVRHLTRREIPALPFEEMAGLGVGGKPDLWLRPSAEPLAPTHIAFACAERKSVDAFHAAALKAGGRDNGRPGLRPQYHPHYYGAFVLDPDGYNVEAVCHREE